MTELATSLSDILLAVGTFFLAIKFKSTKAQQAWRAFFIALAAAAGLGALYHGADMFRIPSFWVLVSAATLTSSFLFFAATSIISKPTWKWLGAMWPIVGLGGLIAGTLLSATPFWVLKAVSTVLIFFALYLLQSCPSKETRKWIFLGVGLSLLGFVIQTVGPADGWWNKNVLFHLCQLAGNVLVWNGAQKA